MKIAMLLKSYPIISEAFLVRQAISLDAKVYTTFVKTENFDRFNLSGQNINCISGTPAWWRKTGDAVLRKMSGEPYQALSFLDQHRFKKVLSQQPPDVMLAPFGPNAINALPACKKLGIPLIIQFLGYDVGSLMNNNTYVQNIKKAMAYASACVVLYPGMEQPLIDVGINHPRIEAINIGVPTRNFAHHHSIPPKSVTKFRFLSVGRFVEKKHPLGIIQAFVKVAHSNPEVTLTMVGDGPLMPQVRSAVESSGFKEKITLPGYQTTVQLQEQYGLHHAFLQHSIVAADGNREGWPVSIAEAASSGLPIVATEHAGIPTQVIHKETGYLVPEMDIDAMASYMQLLADDTTKAWKLGQAGKLHMQQTSDISDQMRKLMTLINEESK